MDIDFNKEELLKTGVTTFHFINFAQQSAVLKEVSAHKLNQAPKVAGKVRQYFSHCNVLPRRAPKTSFYVKQLEGYFKTELKNHLPRGFRFNEVRLQKYEVVKDSNIESGITRHRDEKKYQGIIVVLVIEDGGSFCFDVDGAKKANAERGYCIVMTGSNFNKGVLVSEDTRIKHWVESVTYPRTTIALRFDVKRTFRYWIKKFFQL